MSISPPDYKNGFIRFLLIQGLLAAAVIAAVSFFPVSRPFHPPVAAVPAAVEKEAISGNVPWPFMHERGSYQAKIADTGKALWGVDWETTVSTQEGQTRIEILEQGKGQPIRCSEPIRWEKKMVLSSEPGLAETSSPVIFQSIEGTRWTSRGDVLSRMDVRVDPRRQKISYMDEETGKSRVTKTFGWTPESFPDEFLFHWVRTLPFDKVKKGSSAGGDAVLPQGECNLILSPTRQFRINAKLTGLEEVKTPAGIFSCYRVELIPQLFGPLKKFVPKMALWCVADWPHYWVRYQGPAGGPGSPQAIIELVKFEGSSK